MIRPLDKWLETKLDWWALALLLIGFVIRLRLADLLEPRDKLSKILGLPGKAA